MRPLLSRYIIRARYKRVIPHVRGAVLELGCGFSLVVRTMPDLEAYVGVDYADRPLTYLRDNFPQHTYYHLDLEQEQLDLDRKFDTIVMTAILEHLRSPEIVIRQLPGLLKPDGQVLLTTPTPVGGIAHTLGSHLGFFFREAHEEHERFYDLTNMRIHFEQYGFQINHYERFLYGGNQFLILSK